MGRTKNQQIREINAQADYISFMQGKLNSLEAQIGLLRKENEQLKKRNEYLEAELNEACARADRFEQDARNLTNC